MQPDAGFPVMTIPSSLNKTKLKGEDFPRLVFLSLFLVYKLVGCNAEYLCNSIKLNVGYGAQLVFTLLPLTTVQAIRVASSK